MRDNPSTQSITACDPGALRRSQASLVKDTALAERLAPLVADEEGPLANVVRSLLPGGVHPYTFPGKGKP